MFRSAIVLLLSAFGLVSTVQAQIPAFAFTFDENGNATVTPPFSTPLPYAGLLAADLGPGGLTSALTYSLLGAPFVVSGDVHILDANQTLADVIRFNLDPTLGPLMVFYADDHTGNPADTGFPASAYTNVVTLTEINGSATYTPGMSDPGWLGLPVTYTFTTSVAAASTPEPGTLALLGAGLAGAALVKRRYFFA